MADVILVAILVVFFGLAVLFVKACELIIGPDVEAARADSEPVADEQAAA